MRVSVLFFLIVCLPLVACTSMLLGNGSSGDRNPTTATGNSQPTREDVAISASVRQAFSNDEDIRRYAVGIRTVDGTVTLSGTVGSFLVRDRALDIASGTGGVDHVRNRIVVNTNTN